MVVLVYPFVHIRYTLISRLPNIYKQILRYPLERCTNAFRERLTSRHELPTTEYLRRYATYRWLSGKQKWILNKQERSYDLTARNPKLLWLYVLLRSCTGRRLLSEEVTALSWWPTKQDNRKRCRTFTIGSYCLWDRRSSLCSCNVISV